MKTLVALVVAVVGCLATDARATERFAVIVGNNAGHDFRRALRFAERDAEKMRDVLVELGGFEARNVELFRGRDADEVRSALVTLEERFAAAQAKGEESLLVFYYSGHADGGALELGSSSLSFAELTQLLRGSRATVRLAFVDACSSGTLVATKGAARVAPFPIMRVDTELASSGYAVLTSSTSNELSQESASIRGSLFTHHLVSGLRGAADRSGDGIVTLAEAYTYTYEHTVARSSASIAIAQHPMYDFQLRGRGEVELTIPKRATSLLHVSSADAGQLFVLNARQDRVFAEAELPARSTVELALPLGAYRVVYTAGESARRADVTITALGTVHLDTERDFVAVVLDDHVDKGGLFVADWSNEIGVGPAVQRFALGEQAASYGVTAWFARVHPRGWLAMVRASVAAAPDVGAASGTREARAYVGGGWQTSGRVVMFRLTALAGVSAIRQDPRDGDDRYNIAPGYLALASVAAPVARDLLLRLDAGGGGRLLRLRDQGVTHSLDAVASVGLAWTW